MIFGHVHLLAKNKLMESQSTLHRVVNKEFNTIRIQSSILKPELFMQSVCKQNTRTN